MKGYVETVEKSKSGKAWRVKVDGNWINARFDSKIESAINKSIDYITKDDPKYGVWLQSWMFDNPAVSEPVQLLARQIPAEPLPRPQPAQPIGKDSDRWWLPFCSNQCAHAIASGAIKEPSQIKPWLVAAYRAVTSVQAIDDDRIPF